MRKINLELAKEFKQKIVFNKRELRQCCESNWHALEFETDPYQKQKHDQGYRLGPGNGTIQVSVILVHVDEWFNLRKFRMIGGGGGCKPLMLTNNLL